MPDRGLYLKLCNVPRAATAQVAFFTLSEVQQFRPEQQIVALAALFLLVCEHYRVSAQDAFTFAKNLMNDHDGKLATEFEAIRLFLKEEHR